MGAFAPFERDLIRERQRAGPALANLREGAYVGHKPCLNLAQARELRRRVAADGACRGAGHQSSDSMSVRRRSMDLAIRVYRQRHGTTSIPLL